MFPVFGVMSSIPNGPVGQVLSYGLVGRSISEGGTRPDQISWSSQVSPCFGLVRPGFVLQCRKLSIRASVRTWVNLFPLLILKYPVPAQKTLNRGEINPFIVYHGHIFLLGECLRGDGCLLLAYLVKDKVEEASSRGYFCFSFRD